MEHFEYIIVGAGPAGLTTRYGLYLQNQHNYLLIDSGTDLSQRDRYNPKDCIEGIGGAGLFSDGKFSFYPAGEKLWLLEQTNLKKSYAQLASVFQDLLEIPPYPDRPTHCQMKQANEKWELKQYPSVYLSLDERTALISVLLREIRQEQLALNTNVEHIEYDGLTDTYIVHCLQDNHPVLFSCKKLILSGGRFFPMLSQSFPMIKHIFKRVELGMRVCGPSTNELYSVSTQIDPKFIKMNTNNIVEYRTFCWCRKGECVSTQHDDIITFSGRADCAPTTESNFGFNARFKTEDALTLLETAIHTPSFKVPLTNIDHLINVYGAVGTYLSAGIKSLLDEFGKVASIDRNQITLVGPTIEGVGNYPVLDENLKVPGENIWVVGDATGIFRGIVPAMLSGLFVINQSTMAD
jgi:uncharacterized FAD-dependent dehydrogenase